MSIDKRCVQCGIVKPPDEFRPYTHAKHKDSNVGKMARYRVCRECEALNSRYKRALAKGDYEESDRINELYIALEALGYRTPKSSKSRKPDSHKATDEAVQRILDHHGATAITTVRRDPDYKRPETMKPSPSPIEFYAVDNPYEPYLVVDEPEVIAEIEPEAPETKDAATQIPKELSYWLDISVQEWIDNDISPEYLQETIYESLKAKYRPQTGVDRNTYTPIYDDTYRTILNDILKKFDDYEESMAQELAEDNIELIPLEGSEDDERSE